jgi:hypothetical protein
MGGVKKGSQRIQTSQSKNVERKLPKLPAGCRAAAVSVLSTSLPPGVAIPNAPDRSRFPDKVLYES